jgi:hypothetical protein
MSGPLAFASVTAVLKDLLNDGLVNSDLSSIVGTVKVSALPPDRIATGAEEPSQLNVFLYQVMANPGWRNADLPSRSAGGDQRLTNPPLAVDLHYLLTAYGAQDLDAEVLLGYAMQLMHETPVLTRAAIRKTFSVSSPVSDKLMPAAVTDRNPADIADQLELCRITPRYLTTDELSKLWSAMQARYRPTMAYTVSVVLMQRTAPARAALPVREPRLHVVPMARPVIERLEPSSGPVGSSVRLIGQSLKGVITSVRIGGQQLVPAPADTSSQAVRVALPGSLRAGLASVQVVHDVPLGDPPTSRPGVGVESNVAAFIVTPVVISPSPHTLDGSRMLTIALSPNVARDQRVVVLLGDVALLVPARPEAGPPTSATVAVAVPAAFPAGTHLLRVQVDGAMSPLTVDDTEGSMTFNQYVGPTVTIP